MSTRFVILHHVLSRGEHWDLMLEHGDVLLTWRLPVQPDGALTPPIDALAIGDHRKAYLDYEGPISGNRGHVVRVDGGALRLLDRRSDVVTFEADGVRLRGRWRLRRIKGDTWTLEACAPDSALPTDPDNHP